MSFTYSSIAKEVEVYQLKNSGSSLKKAPFDKMGIAFMTWPDSTTMLEMTPKLNSLFSINSYEF